METNSTGPLAEMGNCSSILEVKNHRLGIFLAVFLSIIFIFGTLFNSFAFWVFCYKMKKWTETRVYMMSLLLSDCCLLFTIPFRIYATLYDWTLGVELCHYLLSSYFMNTYSSIALITLIAIDRYIAIRFPMKARTLRSPKKAVIACGIIWFPLLIIRIHIGLKDIKPLNRRFCFKKINSNPVQIGLYYTIFGFFLPFLIVTFCSMEIIRTLKKKDLLSSQDHTMQKTINIVTSNLVTFLVCFLPLSIGKILSYIVESLSLDCNLIKNVYDYVFCAQVIADVNCCLDAVSYYFVATEFWEKASLSPKLKIVHQTQDPTQDSNL
uniref:G-protein coupled receptors family 1 profile domain-containing protein n=1 Tax=Leptobrachium leishanense TaxID=445787 RepID=A0A8C5R2E3_9ANUR